MLPMSDAFREVWHQKRMKALRIVLYVLAGACLLLIVAAVILVRSFDLNDYKDEITAYVQDRTGRTLAIDDNIEFSLFPWFAVETGGVSLSDDPEFGELDFVTVDSLSARIRVWPLLRRRIEIGRVVLDGITLNLGVDAEGRGNWSTLVRNGEPEAPAVGIAGPDRPSIEQLAVEGIELRNARILWHDANGDVIYLVRDMTLTTGPINDNDPVEVAVSLSALDVASQASIELEFQSVAALRPATELTDLAGTIRLLDPGEQERASATFNVDSIARDKNFIRTGPINIAAVLRRPPLGPDELTIDAEIGAIELDTDLEALAIDGFTARSGGLNASLNVRGSRVLSDPELGGTIDIRSATIAGLFETLGRPTPADLGSADVGGLTANAEFDLGLATRSMAVNRFAVTALGLEATGHALLDADQVLSATIDVPAFEPTDSLIALLEPQVPQGVDLGAVNSAQLSLNLELATASGALTVPAFSIDLDDASLAGRLTIDRIGTPDRIEGAIAMRGLDNRLLNALFGPWLPDELIETDLGDFRLDTDFTHSAESGVADFAPLQLSAYGLTGEGQLTAARANDALTLSGRAAVAEFSPRDLLQRFGLPIPETADGTVLRSAELAASFETTGARGEFRDIAVELDDSRITGEFSVENFADPAYRFVLRADRIDADRYLPPTAEPLAAGPTAAGAAAATAAAPVEKRLGDIALASEPLTNTKVSGTASVGSLRIGGMDFEQLETDVNFGDGRAELGSVRTELYGGEFDGGLAIDASGESGEVHLTGNARNVALQPLLEAMLGSAHLSGTGNVQLDLTGRGDTINEALQTAAGQLNIEFRDGLIDGVNLGRKLCEAVNLARGLPPPATASDTTRYTVIRGNATVSGGNASSTDLFAATAFVDLTGSGDVRLADQWIDNQYRAQLTGPIAIAGCESMNETIANSPIPINFTLQGQLPDIQVGIDRSQLLRDWTRREIRQRAEDSIRDAILDRVLN
jgi:AsmA protein